MQQTGRNYIGKYGIISFEIIPPNGMSNYARSAYIISFEIIPPNGMSNYVRSAYIISFEIMAHDIWERVYEI